MTRNEKQIFNPLNGEEQNDVIGSYTFTRGKEFEEKTFFEKHGIYQI